VAKPPIEHPACLRESAGMVLWRSGAWLLGSLLFVTKAGAQEPKPAPIVVVFDRSAAHFPQADIRTAIAHELHRPVQTVVEPELPEISVSLNERRQIIVRYVAKEGAIDRFLPLPARVDEVPLIISLAAGNLARNQSDVVRQLETRKSSRETPAAAVVSDSALAPAATPPATDDEEDDVDDEDDVEPPARRCPHPRVCKNAAIAAPESLPARENQSPPRGYHRARQLRTLPVVAGAALVGTGVLLIALNPGAGTESVSSGGTRTVSDRSSDARWLVGSSALVTGVLLIVYGLVDREEVFLRGEAHIGVSADVSKTQAQGSLRVKF
ncbi:MAG TPA: hypothetical protein VGP93_10320, partial [Polyangiaceae bacterium]|nr:hypothetical protein [Polyangiaceae bacterium]